MQKQTYTKGRYCETLGTNRAPAREGVCVGENLGPSEARWAVRTQEPALTLTVEL